MGDQSKIGWTEATWNPVTGCSRVSEGCQHCYAEVWSHRYGWTEKPWTVTHASENVRLHPERLDQPVRWQKPRRIFVNSMSDLFHPQVPFEFLDRVFGVMASTSHTYQILTKRPDRMHEYLTDYAAGGRHIWKAAQTVKLPRGRFKPETGWPLPNVWLGVSVENQARADERIPWLLKSPATVRFISCEPLLGPMDLTEIHGETVLEPKCWGDCACDSVYGYDPGCVRHGGGGYLTRKIDWVIVGAESGPGARPMDDDWVRQIRDQCVTANVAFFFKQRVCHGRKEVEPLLDGRQWLEYPQIEQADPV